MDLYSLMEREDRRHNRGACPVCNVELALADIEGHVNRCLDLALQSDDEQLAKSLARSGYHPHLNDAAPATSGAGRGEPRVDRLPAKHGTFSAEDHAYASLLLQEMDTDDDQDDFTDLPLDDSAERKLGSQMTKPAGLALDMAALRLSQSADAARESCTNGHRTPDTKPAATIAEAKGKGKQRLLVDDELDDDAYSKPVIDNERHESDVNSGLENDDDDSDSDNGEKVEFAIRLETMSKRQIKRLCMKQHRKIKQLRFHIKTLEKDLKSVSVANAMDDDWQSEARNEWEAELQRQKDRANERETERRKAADAADEAKALTAALEAPTRQQEADRAAAAAAALAQEIEAKAETEHQQSLEAAEQEWPETGVEGNGLLGLPKEVMLTVFVNLAARDLANLSRTCKLLADPAQDPLLWRRLFVLWLRAENAKWSDVDEQSIVLRFDPKAQSKGDKDKGESESVPEERAWYLQFKQRYEKWRYATVTGNGERWLWDRCRNTLSGFSFCTRTNQKWTFDGSRLRVLAGLFNYPTLEWRSDSLRIQFRPQKVFLCRAGVGIRDTFWNQELWRFTRADPPSEQRPDDDLSADPDAPENASFMAIRVAMGGTGSLRAPYRVEGDMPLAIVSLVLLQATGHL